MEADLGEAMKTVDELVTKLAIESNADVSNQKVRNAIAKDQGLRTSFATAGNSGKIITNYLTLKPPKLLYVYSVEMIRDRSANAPAVKVRKFEDRKVIQILERELAALRPDNDGITRWVTDGDLIWSTKRLFQQVSQGTRVIRITHAPPQQTSATSTRPVKLSHGWTSQFPSIMRST